MKTSSYISINIANQELTLIEDGKITKIYPISSSANGCGCESGSHKTPTGLHRIKLKIGAGQPLGAVFIGRRLTGEIYSEELRASAPTRDWILTRILWLDGIEYAKNKGGNLDSLRRYI